MLRMNSQPPMSHALSSCNSNTNVFKTLCVSNNCTSKKRNKSLHEGHLQQLHALELSWPDCQGQNLQWEGPTLGFILWSLSILVVILS